MNPKGKVSRVVLWRLVRRNLRKLCEACYLAAAWQESSWDSERASDPVEAKKYLRDAKRYERLHKALLSHLPNDIDEPRPQLARHVRQHGA